MDVLGRWPRCAQGQQGVVAGARTRELRTFSSLAPLSGLYSLGVERRGGPRVLTFDLCSALRILPGEYRVGPCRAARPGPGQHSNDRESNIGPPHRFVTFMLLPAQSRLGSMEGRRHRYRGGDIRQRSSSHHDDGLQHQQRAGTMYTTMGDFPPRESESERPTAWTSERMDLLAGIVAASAVAAAPPLASRNRPSVPIVPSGIVVARLPLLDR